MRFRRTRAAEATAFHKALMDPDGAGPEHAAMLRIAAALQPAQPLNEARRDMAKAAMLRAATASQQTPSVDAGSMDDRDASPAVHTAEVVVDGVVVRVADVEPIDKGRALRAGQQAAWMDRHPTAPRNRP